MKKSILEEKVWHRYDSITEGLKKSIRTLRCCWFVKKINKRNKCQIRYKGRKLVGFIMRYA